MNKYRISDLLNPTNDQTISATSALSAIVIFFQIIGFKERPTQARLQENINTVFGRFLVLNKNTNRMCWYNRDGYSYNPYKSVERMI